MSNEELIETNLLDIHDKPAREASGPRQQAKQLGLSYIGFGRYGIKNKKGEFKVTHVVRNDQLKAITQTKYDEKTGRMEHLPQKIPEKEFGAWRNKFQGKYEKSILKGGAKSVDTKYDGDASGDIRVDVGADVYKKTKKLRADILSSNTKKYTENKIHQDKKIQGVLRKFIETTDDINTHIHIGPSPDRHKERMASWKIRMMDNAFKNDTFKSDHDYSTYTGTKIKLENGKTFKFKGFLSTTLNPSAAQGQELDHTKGETRKPTMIQIDLKKGQRVIDVNAAVPDNGHAEDDEHILPRNTKLKMVDGPIASPEGEVWRAEIVEA